MARGNASQNAGPSRRMKPARQTSGAACGLIASTSAASYASRDGKSRVRQHDRRDAAVARERPGPARPRDSKSRPRSRARSRPASIARAIAARLLPRPEIKTASGDGLPRFPHRGQACFPQARSIASIRGRGIRLANSGGPTCHDAPRIVRVRALLPRHQPRRRQGAAVHQTARLSRVSRHSARGPRPPSGARCSRTACCRTTGTWCSGPTGTPSLSRLLHWVTTTHAVRFGVASEDRRGRSGLPGPVQGAGPIEEAGDLVAICRYVERNALDRRARPARAGLALGQPGGAAAAESDGSAGRTRRSSAPTPGSTTSTR